MIRLKKKQRLPNQQVTEVLGRLPRLPRMTAQVGPLSKARYSQQESVIQIVSSHRRRLPYTNEFKARRVRQKLKRQEAVALTLPNGSTAVQLEVDPRDTFATLSELRKALDLLHLPAGGKLAIDLRRKAQRRKLTRLATYAAVVHSASMPSFERKHKDKPATISIHGYSSLNEVAHGTAAAHANSLCRQLCILPSNILDAKRLIDIAKEASIVHELEYELFDIKKLKELNANLFLSVCGDNKHGGLVRLRYRCKKATAPHIAVLGKGVCFDTGGINLKPHKYMLGMQADMAGAAAALGTIIAAKKLALKVNLDVWLAVAENLVTANGAKPGDTVTAHNGKSVEIVHTDAEGRMLLADSLSILADDKPDMVITLATLTGSMVEAVGDHMSGVTGSPQLVRQASVVGKNCGERLVPFPLPTDYMEYLKSDVADLLQCSAGEEPDHILAGLFLQEFTGKIPWLHLDLSASNKKGGLGAIPSDQTGFGATWLIAWLEHQAKLPR